MVIVLAAGFACSAAGETGFTSMGLGGSSRVSAMGNASAASVYGAGAAYYNPAALSFNSGNSFVLSTYKWIDNVSGAFAAWSKTGDNSGFSLFANVAAVDDIEYRTGPTPEPISTFSFYEGVAGAAYSRIIGPGLSIGASIKGYYTKVFVHEAVGIGCDAGCMWKPGSMPFSLGCAVQNLGSMTKLNREAVVLPLTVRAGASVPVPMGRNKLLVAADVVSRREYGTRVQAGAEFRLDTFLFLRCGYETGKELSGFTAGAGITWQTYQFNYAYIPYSNQWHDMHKISVELSW